MWSLERLFCLICATENRLSSVQTLQHAGLSMSQSARNAQLFCRWVRWPWLRDGHALVGGGGTPLLGVRFSGGAPPFPEGPDLRPSVVLLLMETWNWNSVGFHWRPRFRRIPSYGRDLLRDLLQFPGPNIQCIPNSKTLTYCTTKPSTRTVHRPLIFRIPPIHRSASRCPAGGGRSPDHRARCRAGARGSGAGRGAGRGDGAPTARAGAAAAW